MMGRGQFNERMVSDIGFRGAREAIVGDFNNDNHLDLIVHIFGNEHYPIFCEGSGEGTFTASPSLPASFNSRLFLESVDFDEDGNLDLFAVREDSIYLWKGSGNGTFSKSKLVDSPEHSRVLSVTDYDQDGFKDVIIATQWGATYIYWGEDGGTLTPHRLLPEPVFTTEPRSDAKWMAKSVDLNEDGLLDIVTIISEGEGLAIYLNLGERKFIEAKFYQLHSKPSFLEVVDFDQDGVIDIAVNSEFSTGEYLSLFRGRGDGSFVLSNEKLISTEFVRGMVQDDFNNDKKADIAFLFNSDEIHLLFSPYLPQSTDCNHDGILDGCQEELIDSESCIFQLPPYLDCNGNQIQDQIEIFEDPSKDCDQDGVLDSCANAIGVFKARRTSTILSDSFPSQVQTVEVTGDNKTDILITHEDSTHITLLKQEEPRQFSKIRLPTIREANDLAVADFNSDGHSDIACIIEGVHESALAMLFGLGGGEFEEAQEFPTYSTSFASICNGDFNGDGKADLVLTSSNGHEVQVLLGTGDGTFTIPVVYSPLRILSLNDSPYPSDYRKVRVADLDVDGFDDVIFANGFGESIAIFFGNSDGIMTPAESIYVFGGPTDLAFSDIDLDGDLDILCSRGRASAGIIFNLGHRKFSLYRGLLPAESSTSISSGDINHDGIPDLAVAANRNGYLGIYLGHGDGTFQPHRKLSAGSEPFSVALDDVDGDGWMDILSVDVDFRHLSIFYGEDNTIQNSEGVDCNENDIPDLCELNLDPSLDCNENGQLDSCELKLGTIIDCNENGIPDTCELNLDPNLDCNENGLLDSCELQSGAINDCNNNSIPDTCELNLNSSLDCNKNAILDSCEIQSNLELDLNSNGILDSCEPQGCKIPGDCNADDVLDISDAVCQFTVLFVNGEQELPCGDGRVFHPANIKLLDWQGDKIMDISDPIALLRFLFLSEAPHILSVPGEELTGCIQILDCPE